MKSILVIGMGRFGRHCARELVSLGHEVMAIDKYEKNIDNIAGEVSNAQIGDATDPLFMESLGIADFDICIVCIGDDFQASLEATCLCKELGCPFVVARAARDIHRKFLLKMGADKVVYPEKQMAIWTAVTYSSEHVLDYIPMDEQHAIYEVEIPVSWNNKSVIDLNVRQKYNITILAIKDSNNKVLTVNPQTIFKSDMSMLVLAEKKAMQKFLKY
ncbi:potassium channel family protein [Floccifex sp.]|uniref:potassium channel family protein n=1 Tax=Floccifex sp. TaxID=2815810 RepID=UPI003F0862DE